MQGPSILYLCGLSPHQSLFSNKLCEMLTCLLLALHKTGTRVCVCVCVCVDTMCQGRTLCMYSPCQERTCNQEQTHSMPAVGFGIRFGLVIIENPETDHKIMGQLESVLGIESISRIILYINESPLLVKTSHILVHTSHAKC